MNAQRWQQLRPILESALELDPACRNDLLDSTCLDASLRQQVESLLRAHDGAAPDLLNPEMESHSRLQAGSRIGPYEVLEEVAEGGMGAVYRAIRADGQYRQQVALKVVRAELAGPAVSARFRGERQILAHLDHPNIGKILDGGTTAEGLPYFVMEWIDGVPITNYCDREKLTIEQRLHLFRTICAAVHYAHQRLVIHRDIKPTNILVAQDGIPKLLDFGIAKVLDPELFPEKEAMTTAGISIMTPEYASPEQFRGEPVTTASDIFSLGLVLFELLTGDQTYHFPNRMLHEIARLVLETEPEPPSAAARRSKTDSDGLPGITKQALSRRLAGDLDNIVGKALRKAPGERYQSAEQFADDIRRHLGSLPILARKDTARYRAAKFVKRHRAGVLAAASIAFLLLSTLAVTLREARIARMERRAAEQRFSDVRELARSNLFEFSDALQKLPGSASARHLVIQRALGYLDKLNRDGGGDPGLLRELAAGYERIAGLQGNFSGPGIGDTAASLENYRKALAIRDTLVARSKENVAEIEAEVSLLRNFGLALLVAGRIEEASRMASQELVAAESISRRLPADRGAILEQARAHLRIGMMTGGSGSSASTRQFPEAIAHDRNAIGLLAQIPPPARNPSEQTAFVDATISLALHLNKQRRFAEALKALDGLVAGEKDISNPNNRYLVHDWRAMVLDRMGDYRAALGERRKSLDLIELMLQADPHSLQAQITVALARGSIGILQARLGDKADGKKLLDAAIARGESLLAADPQRLFYKNLLLIGYGYQAEILSSLDDQKGAQQKYAQAIQAATDLARNDSQDLESPLSLAKLHLAMGVVLARDRQFVRAREEIATGQRSLDQLLLARPQDAEGLYTRDMIRTTLARLQHCTEGRPCPALRQLTLPNLTN